MNRWVLDTLCCPVCRGSFILSEIKGNDTEISEGILTCSKCGARYPIEDGIANLIPDNLR
ncbi:MAG TPA: methytransferase partner Trm112 [Methanocorpusculum sp.]|nr:methytransferase partner Trm112 [Methanocorpusculum sp.]